MVLDEMPRRFRSFPAPRLAVTIDRTVSADWGYRESLLDFAFDEDGSFLVTFIRVLFEHRGMMLPLILAALEQGGEKVSELWVCVLRVMDVREAPITLPKHEACKTVSAGGGEAWDAANKSFIHDGHF